MARLPKGFRFAAGYAGIRKLAAPDLAVMVSDAPAAAAGVFTRNSVRAAPVDISAESLRRSGGTARVVVANAGNANCATPNMVAVATETARAAASIAGVPQDQILLASTGVIGEPVGIDVIPAALPDLWERVDRQQFADCAKAIMTTDTVPKVRFAEVETPRGRVLLAGMAKGAGMIMPDMATMLSFLFTDAGIAPERIRAMLGRTVDQSFNCVTVDSDTSTNDTVFLLANGQSGVTVDGELESSFQRALDGLTMGLARDIARDGEGASKLAEICVEGAASDGDAKTLALAIANSPLVKTALAGADPNWGRILGAAGKSSVAFDPAMADVFISGCQVCSSGVRADFDEPSVQRRMEEEEVGIRFFLRGGGPGRAVVWTCDFTQDYIRINADYRT